MENAICAPPTSWWDKYKYFVENATRVITSTESSKIAYLRDRLFTNFITFLFPVCLIALIPGVFMGIKTGDLFIAGADVATVLLIAVVVLNVKFSLAFRKLFVIFMMYSLTIALIVNLGLLGPGTVYLVLMSVLITLLFPSYLAYWSVALNLLICLTCALIIDLKLFNSPLIIEYNLETWMAVSSNIIFISLISVVLIGSTISSLENTINMEFRLKTELALVNIEIFRRNQLMKESEIHYKTLFFTNPSPMWVLNNENLMFLQVNESAIREYGYTNKEFMTMTLADIKMDSDMLNIHEDLQKPIYDGMPSSITTEHRRKNTEQFPVEVRYNSFLFNGKEATLSIIRDMTEQINFIKAIEAQNIKLREIAWMQSHIVRAPLARILGLIDLLVSNKNKIPDAEVLTYLDKSAKEFDDIIKTIIGKTELI